MNEGNFYVEPYAASDKVLLALSKRVARLERQIESLMKFNIKAGMKRGGPKRYKRSGNAKT